jgi:hypothetical protein
MTLLSWAAVIVVVAVVAAIVGVLVLRAVRDGTPHVPDALDHLPSRGDQPVAFSEGRPVTEAEEPPAETGDDAAFERVLHEELDDVRGDEPKT